MTIDFKHGDNISEQFFIKEKNVYDVQQKKLRENPREIIGDARGEGIAFVMISCEYLEKVDVTEPHYKLDVGADLSYDDKIMTVHIAAKALVNKTESDVRGLSVLEIELPEGFEFQDEEQTYRGLAVFDVKVRFFSCVKLEKKHVIHLNFFVVITECQVHQ